MLHNSGRRALLIGIIAAAIVAAGLWIWIAASGKGDEDLLHMRVKSGNLSVDYTEDQALADVRRLRLNTVNVPVIVRVENLKSSSMELDEDSLRKAQGLIPRLHQMGLKVIVEPYPWIDSGNEVETNWNPTDPDRFFAEWRSNVLLPLAEELAVPTGAEAMIAASNLVHLESFSSYWAQLIRGLREVYSGLVTYKTNWWYTAQWDSSSLEAYRAKLNNPLWSEVDFISIAAYFELTDRPVNSADELTAALRESQVYGRSQNIENEVMELGQRWHKPVYFGELGFPARAYAAKEPWNPSPSNTVDGAEQARLFQAYRDVFGGREGFLGFSVFAIGETGPDKHYYPSDESAMVISSWGG